MIEKVSYPNSNKILTHSCTFAPVIYIFVAQYSLNYAY